MGTTIQPLTDEEVDHRITLARMFQDSTLAQLKTAAELYREDRDAEAPDYDPASAAQLVVELGRRGEWSENALATDQLRRQAEYVANQPNEGLDFLLINMPRAGLATTHDAVRVHLARAEQWLRLSEARLASEQLPA
jgi:hypothetical protein